jgi:hypothetical protein
MTVETVGSEESSDVEATPTAAGSSRGSRFPMPPAVNTPRTGSTSPIGEGSPGTAFDLNNMSNETASLFAMFRAMAAATAHPYRPPANQLETPRVGGINKSGVWVGQGLQQLGQEPNSHHCMREFTSEGTKEMIALGKIKEFCKAGLKETGPKFSLSHEKEIQPLVPCIKAIQEHMEQCGLEGVFIIVTASGTPINMFKYPALASIDIIQTWILDLTTHGVHNGTGGRHPICKFDAMNLSLSGKAIFNSCSPLLQDEINRKLPSPQDQTGPRVYYEVVQLVATLSISYTRELEGKLKALSLKSIPGENVELYAQTAMNLVDEIRMTALLPSLVPNLPSLALQGLSEASDPIVSHEAALALAKCEDPTLLHLQSGGALTSGILMEPMEVLAPLVRLYKVLHQSGKYGPSKTVKVVPAMTAEVREMLQAEVQEIKRTLEQDKTKGRSSSRSNSSSPRTCYECGSPDHLRNACPKLQDKGDTTNKGTPKNMIPGLSTAENKEVDSLIANKVKTLEPLSDVPSDAKHEIVYKGKSVAKFCGICKRFLKGAKAHYTEDHRGKRNAKSEGTTDSTPESPSGQLAAIAPSLMRCEVPDYSTPSTVWYGALENEDDASVDSACLAFMAFAPDESPHPPVQVPPVVMEGPWYEVVHSDGQMTLFHGHGPDATGYDPTWFADRGLPSTAAELNAQASPFKPEAPADDTSFQLVCRKEHPKGRRGRATQ